MALPHGLLGVVSAMLGILLLSTVLTYVAAQWGHRNQARLAVRAFRHGMAPIVAALLLATSWILATPSGSSLKYWPVWLQTATTAVVVWRTKIQPLWLLGAGALFGGYGLI